jgi:hypothetical protein
VADDLAVDVQNLARCLDGSSYHGREIAVDTAEDSAIPVEDVAKLIDELAIEVFGQVLR